jgi:PIN domain nuclease of toxin-antitoxin system
VKLLLDTQFLLWSMAHPEWLPARARSLVNDPDNQVVFSVASIWEVAIKHSLGRSDFDVPPILLRETLLENGYIELPVMGPHAAIVGGLPPIHKDPFDRLLIAQAVVEGITLLTADSVIARYPGPIQKI